MRPTSIATLLLSPMLLVASAVASQPNADAPAATPAHVSTGITAAQMINPNIHIAADTLGHASAEDAQVVLSLNVDEKGNAQNVRVVKSVNPELDSRVVTAVLRSRFRPAKLDNQAIPVDVALTVKVQR
jgi:TonB family protein